MYVETLGKRSSKIQKKSREKKKSTMTSVDKKKTRIQQHTIMKRYKPYHKNSKTLKLRKMSSKKSGQKIKSFIIRRWERLNKTKT